MRNALSLISATFTFHLQINKLYVLFSKEYHSNTLERKHKQSWKEALMQRIMIQNNSFRTYYSLAVYQFESNWFVLAN